MRKDDNTPHAAKRQRLDNSTEQRTTFEEDMARIRAAMNADAASSAASPSASVGGGGSRSNAIPSGPAAGDYFPQQQQLYHQPQLSVQQHRTSGVSVSTLQQHQRPRQNHLQQQQAQPVNSPRSTIFNAQASMEGGFDSDDDDRGGSWLQSFTPRSATRVGENYQVTNLPAAPPRVDPPASSSRVSSGVGSG